MELEDFECYIKLGDNSFIDEIYESRENDNAFITNGFKNLLKRKKINTEKEYNRFRNKINKLPKHCNYLKEDLLKELNTYKEKLNEENSFYNQRYYKVGFVDGAKFEIDKNRI